MSVQELVSAIKYARRASWDGAVENLVRLGDKSAVIPLLELAAESILASEREKLVAALDQIDPSWKGNRAVIKLISGLGTRLRQEESISRSRSLAHLLVLVSTDSSFAELSELLDSERVSVFNQRAVLGALRESADSRAIQQVDMYRNREDLHGTQIPSSNSRPLTIKISCTHLSGFEDLGAVKKTEYSARSGLIHLFGPRKGTARTFIECPKCTNEILLELTGEDVCEQGKKKAGWAFLVLIVASIAWLLAGVPWWVVLIAGVIASVAIWAGIPETVGQLDNSGRRREEHETYTHTVGRG